MGIQNLKDAIRQETLDRTLAIRSLCTQINSAHQNPILSNDKFPVIHNENEDFEDSFIPRLTELQKALDIMANEQAAGQKKLEQRIAQISTKLDDEHTARILSMDKIEQMIMTSGIKMRSLAATVKQAHESLECCQTTIREEATAREVEQAAIKDQLSKYKTTINSRMDSLVSSQLDFERRFQTEHGAQERDSASKHARKAEALDRQIRCLCDSVLKHVFSERAAHEETLCAFEKHVDHVDQLFKDTRGRFTPRSVSVELSVDSPDRRSPDFTKKDRVASVHCNLEENIANTADQARRSHGNNRGQQLPPQSHRSQKDIQCNVADTCEKLGAELAAILVRRRIASEKASKMATEMVSRPPTVLSSDNALSSTCGHERIMSPVLANHTRNRAASTASLCNTNVAKKSDSEIEQEACEGPPTQLHHCPTEKIILDQGIGPNYRPTEKIILDQGIGPNYRKIRTDRIFSSFDAADHMESTAADLSHLK